ncbi:MAG: cell cycle transcriptional regulator TrcR [Pseudomonadota bacterium]
MSNALLMPKATAVWLVDNTSLTFEQIAEFCGLHVLEVKGIADGDVAQGIKGSDPISSGQLTRAELDKGDKDANYRLKMSESKVDIPTVKSKKAPRYTPTTVRQERPNAILWLIRNHEELKDAQIIRLVGTTKPTIAAIRDRTHHNSASLAPTDPVTIGLCTQVDLDREVQKAAERVARERKKEEKEMALAGTLAPAEETAPAKNDASPPKDKGYAKIITAEQMAEMQREQEEKLLAQEALLGRSPEQREKQPDADSVFARFKDK